MASAQPPKRPTGKASVGRENQHKNMQYPYLNKLMRHIIDIEITKYPNAGYTMILHTTYNFINTNGKNMNIKELLQAHYDYDKTENHGAPASESVELPNLLILLGIGIECPNATGKRTPAQYMFLVQYYKAIVMVYDTKITNKTEDTLYNFIMSYFASVC